jgi:hypothetical protein
MDLQPCIRFHTCSQQGNRSSLTQCDEAESPHSPSDNGTNVGVGASGGAGGVWQYHGCEHAGETVWYAGRGRAASALWMPLPGPCPQLLDLQAGVGWPSKVRAMAFWLRRYTYSSILAMAATLLPCPCYLYRGRWKVSAIAKALKWNTRPH